MSASHSPGGGGTDCAAHKVKSKSWRVQGGGWCRCRTSKGAVAINAQPLSSLIVDRVHHFSMLRSS